MFFSLRAEDLPVEVRTPWDGKMLKVQQAIRECKDVETFRGLVTVGDDILGLFPILAPLSKAVKGIMLSAAGKAI